MGETVAEESEGPGLVALFLMRSGEIESSCSELPGILQAAGQERDLAQPGDGDHMT